MNATAAPQGSGQREVIRLNAIQLFGKQGYTGTSMRDIAGAVGVLPGSLYAWSTSSTTGYPGSSIVSHRMLRPKVRPSIDCGR